MRRIYASSRVVSKNNTVSIPRLELNTLKMAAKKAKELATELNINMKNVFLHGDSLICLYWIKKKIGELNTYCANRVKKIQDTGLSVFYTNTTTNPADFVSKVKKASSFLNNPLYDQGPKYMEEENWMVGKTIEE